MKWYSDNGAQPGPLPWRIRLPNGKTRTDPDQFTNEDIEAAGFFEVPEPPVINENQVLSWNGSSWVVTDVMPPAE